MTKMLSPVFWFWIPVVFMGVQILIEIFLEGELLSIMHSENGPHESFQAIFAGLGFCVALYSFFNSKISHTYLLRAWFGLAALCCFYVAGEEISWGQHIWDWTTPDFWTEVNDQQETNLHNTSSWLDQKPRLVLLLGIVGGTLIAPLLKKRGLLKLPERLDILLPPKELTVIALLVVIPQLLEKIFELFDILIFARFSEVQELYMFYFVLLYLVMLKAKVRKS